MKAASFNREMRWLAVLVGGAVLYAAPILYPRLAALAFFATFPWLMFILSPNLLGQARSPLWFLSLVYLGALLSLNWLASVNLAGLFISPLFYMPLFLPTFYITRGLRSLWPALPLSVIWGLSLTGTEWLRIWASPGEIPFCQLGAALAPFTKLIQVVDVAGVSALSTLAAVVAGFAADTVLYLTSPKERHRIKGIAWSFGLLLAAFSLTMWYGYQHDRTDMFSPGPQLEVVQTNMAGWRDELAARLKLQRAVDLTLSNTPRSGVDLIVWPENSVIPPAANTGPSNNDPVGEVAALSHDVGVPILFDGPFDIQDLSERHRAALVRPDGTVATYNKQRLVPWSEYAPFELTLRSVNAAMADKYLAFVRSRNPDFKATRVEESDSMTVFRYGGQSGATVVFAAPICYEILNPRLVNRWYAAAGDADLLHFFLVNQVNEILLGRSVHNQTLAFCRLRAVEGRVSVIRAANNGTSAAIDPNGRVYNLLADPATGATDNVAGLFFPRVILDTRAGRTVYARFGDWWPVFCLSAAIMLMLTGHARKRRRAVSKPL